MQLNDAFRYVVLTITVTAAIAKAEDKVDPKLEQVSKRVTKRETPLLIETPYEGIHREPHIIYTRRAIRYAVKPPTSKYGPPRPHSYPLRSRYRSYNKRGKNKKFSKGHMKHHRRSPSYKKPPPSPKYREYPELKTKKPQSFYSRQKYGPKPVNTPLHPIEAAGFGEPPSDVVFAMKHRQKHVYDDNKPLVDSYGSPLHQFDDNIFKVQANDGHEEPTQFSWQDHSFDNTNAYSKVRPSFAYVGKPHLETGVAYNEDEDNNENFDINSYTDVYSFGKKIKNSKPKLKDKPKDDYKKPSHKWKGSEPDQEIVGGQYAEPPGRYVPKYQPSAPMYAANDDFGSLKGLDSDMAGSESVSSYVNYKHSNLAFSPQNLNDAFSIVD